MMRSSGLVKIGAVASALALASLTPTAPALAFHGGGGFHDGDWPNGGWGVGGWHGGGWRGAGRRGGGWGWAPAVGLAGWGFPYYDYGYYDDGYYGNVYPTCAYRRLIVRTAYGLRYRTIQYC